MMRRGRDLLLGLFIAGLFLTIILTEITAGLYLLLLAGLAAARRGRRPEAADLLVAGYALLGLVGFAPAYAKHLLLSLVLLAFLPIGWGLRARPRPGLDLWLRLIVGFAVLISLVGIRDHLRGEERAGGLFGGWFTLATLMTWGLPLAVALLVRSRGRERVLYAGAAVLQATALWWTVTRSALLGTVIGFAAWGAARLVVLARRPRASRRPMVLLLAAIGVSLAGLAALAFHSSDPRLNPLSVAAASAGPQVDLTSGRAQIVAEARDIIADDWREGRFGRVLVGHGLASRQRLVGGKFSSWESDYLQAYMDHGLLGLLAVVGLVVLYLRLCLRGLAGPDVRVAALGVAGIIALAMSPLTLKLTGWHSAGVFVVNYHLLRRGLADEAPPRSAPAADPAPPGA